MQSRIAGQHVARIRNSLVILSAFHKKHLDEITATEIEQFKNARLAEGKSPSTVNRDLAFFRLVLAAAVRQDLLQVTPFSQRKVKLLREKGRERIITFAEERRYLAVAGDVLRDVATLILETAMRPGEVFSIRAEDVHLRSNHLHIPSGKTDAATRDVPITERARAVLEVRLAAAKGAHLFPLRVGSGFDWTQPMTTVKDQHRQAIRESGVRTFRLYDPTGIPRQQGPLNRARHRSSCRSFLCHRSLATTSRYVHLLKKASGQ